MASAVDKAIAGAAINEVVRQLTQTAFGQIELSRTTDSVRCFVDHPIAVIVDAVGIPFVFALRKTVGKTDDLTVNAAFGPDITTVLGCVFQSIIDETGPDIDKRPLVSRTVTIIIETVTRLAGTRWWSTDLISVAIAAPCAHILILIAHAVARLRRETFINESIAIVIATVYKLLLLIRLLVRAA